MTEYPSRSRFPVKVVTGYIYPVDTLPAEISFSKSPARVALAFNTYYPEVEGGFFIDFELILIALAPLLEAGKVTVLTEQNERVAFPHLREQWLTRGRKSDWFRQMVIQDQGLTVYQVFGQPWFRVGGPEPYHDTATIEIYMDRDRQDEVRDKVIEALEEAGARVERVTGTRLPLRQRWWRGLFRG